jgi:cell division protein FtsN
MDYRRIVVDYAQSPRVEDALIRLSQLEIARGNYDGALRHLNLLVSDHPQSPARGRAGYWIARALFDKNDIQGGCIATADALTRTSEEDAELRNQITYLNQRCAGVSLTPATTASVPPAINPSTPVSSGTPVDSAKSVATSTPVPAPAKSAADSVKTTRPAVTTPTRTPVPEIPTPINKPRPVEPSTIENPPVVKPPVETPKSSGASVYSVQIAAYNVKSQATAMVAKLKKSGYEARVDGTTAPFRVRIGKYATQSQASAVQRSLKAKQITGFVVQADTQ